MSGKFELNGEIAELLGWTDLQVLGDDDEFGREVEQVLVGTPPGESNEPTPQLVPDYEHDVNEALKLFVDPIPVLRQQLVGTGWCVALFKSTNLDGSMWIMRPGTYVEASTPALALCRAWLAWKKAQ